MNEADHFDVRISYKRKERSKDSNGSDRIFTLVDNILSYNERFWGFKSESRKTKKKSLELSDREYNAIFSFITGKQLNVDYQETIKVDKNYLRNEFTYSIELNTVERSTIYQIQINDWKSDYKPWRDVEKLFDFLQDLIEKA